jgi:N-methylhydantoinase B
MAPVDPITLEIIRHRLWAINDDQARMAARLSGSITVFEGYDFNAALTTADGRGLYCGVYILHHGATVDVFVRRVLEDWAIADIAAGDMFFTNDPWWGSLHANDGILAMPVIWQGELVAWSGIVMHDSDVGSPVPGSFVSGAPDRFAEAPLFPALRIGRDFELAVDIERAYLRNSRTPTLNALNMRARLAALRSTHQRICELIEQYGLDAFRATQEQIIAYVERVVRGRLRALPDGSWYAEGYHDHDGRENKTYRVCCRIDKRGERITFDMTGTAPQVRGSINCARPAMEGAVMGVLLTYLCYDLPWAIGGLRPIAEIVSAEGTLNNALSPAGVSMASTTATLTTQDVVANAFARMLLSSAEYSREAQASWTPGISGGVIVAPDPAGEPHVGPVTDFFSGGGGARSDRDGIDSGGIFHSMASRLANAEMVEQRTPVLQLYRRELCDGGGPGRVRGGTPVEFATVPHKLPQRPAALNTLASGVSVPAGRGLAGGEPGSPAINIVLRGANIRELFAAGRLPGAPEDLTGTREVLEAKSVVAFDEDDVVIGSLAGGGGFGDPIRRDPALVARDVTAGLVSDGEARRIYGVVIEDGEGGTAATAARRAAIRDERLASATLPAAAPPPAEVEGEVLHPASDCVEAVAGPGGDRSLRCSICHRRLCAEDEQLEQHLPFRDRELASANPHNGGCTADFVLRDYYCPGCATALDCQVAPSG